LTRAGRDAQRQGRSAKEEDTPYLLYGGNGLVVPCPFVAGVCNIFYHKHL
jgi:hypothetical protein